MNRIMHCCTAAILALAGIPSSSAGQTERVDAQVMQRIRDEGFQHSRVMETASWLTDVFGPRLTGSPGARRAADWTMKTLASWGISNARLESWPEFGRSWVNEGATAQVLSPVAYPVMAYPTPWTFGTTGAVQGVVTIARIDSEPDFARLHGTLRGKWILIRPPLATLPRFTADACRFDADHLAAMERFGISLGCDEPVASQLARDSINRARASATASASAPIGSGNARLAGRNPGRADVQQFLVNEGAAGVLSPGVGSMGTVIVGGGAGAHLTMPVASIPALNLIPEQYGRIYRAVEKGIEVTFEADIKNRFPSDTGAFNVIAEIPGRDARLSNEIVMLGAHLDSWSAATGATDNAAGVAVMLEAMRILKTLDLPLRRTVRIALWTGEEQGLLGSHSYVRRHFGYVDSTGLHATPEWSGLSAYFNLDDGGGAIRGIYAEHNSGAAAVFKEWLAPFGDLGATTVTLAPTGGTDHQSFDAVGLPGFQFIQDPLDYGTRTHHTNMDLYERLIPRDLMQNAVIVAAFVYDAAMREDKLPRKPPPTVVRP